MVTQAPPDNLSKRARVNGHFVTACSPSAQTVNVMWPDRTVQSVPIADKPPTVAKRDNGDEVWIYPRGPMYDAILSVIEEELQRQEDEIQDVLAETQKDSDTRIEEVMRGEGDIQVFTLEEEPATMLCAYIDAKDHYDCEVCPDPETSETPKHHDTKPKLTGHNNSKLHKRNVKAA